MSDDQSKTLLSDLAHGLISRAAAVQEEGGTTEAVLALSLVADEIIATLTEHKAPSLFTVEQRAKAWEIIKGNGIGPPRERFELMLEALER